MLLRGTSGAPEGNSAGHLAHVLPVLDRLESLEFRFDSETRAAVRKLANE